MNTFDMSWKNLVVILIITIIAIYLIIKIRQPEENEKSSPQSEGE